MNARDTFSIRLTVCLTALFMLLSVFALGEAPDFASRTALNMNSETAKQSVTVKTFVDGDTVHFHVPESIVESGVLKARFLAVNTPESTGKIEEYGKAASAFTREKLSNAESIVVESDNEKWNLDSTGDRRLVWVWYRNEGETEYRNLNIELLQNGLAIANSSANNRYGAVCMEAIAYAKENKLCVYSGKKDPDFYYGDAIELTLKELRTNLAEYEGKKVAFSGVITMNNNNGVFVEGYDAETDMYYGMSVYYGFNMNGMGLDILSVGNEARIVGTLQYYEAGETWQVSGLSYRMMRPDDPGNILKLSDGHKPVYLPTDADTFVNGKVEVETEDEIRVYDYAYLATASSIRMENLTAVDAWVTRDEASSSYGAMTLLCRSEGGETVQVRTIPLYDENRNLIAPDAYLGRVIDVRGIVDFYGGEYQIKVFTNNAIEVKE